MNSEGQAFAIFGSFPAISAAELFVASGRSQQAFTAITTDGAILKAALPRPLASLGGIVKTGTILGSAPTLEAAVSFVTQPGKLPAILPTASGKVLVGVSLYNGTQRDGWVQTQTRRIGSILKKTMTTTGRPVRWVASKERVLSSVVVATNRLIDRGVEIVLFASGGMWWIGKTTAVQDYARYSWRDYGRPSRDAASGMLPPKLAQILLNLSGANPLASLLDPFCGSGTVLMEALLAGYKSVYGSDVSENAVEATKKNLAWLAQQEALPEGWQLVVRQADVRALNRSFAGVRFGSIVTEPYLGPAKGLDAKRLPSALTELAELYRSAFRSFGSVLLPQSPVAIVLPVFFLEKQPRFLPLEEILGGDFRQEELLPAAWHAAFQSGMTEQGTLLYHRSDQRVGREVAVFRRV